MLNVLLLTQSIQSDISLQHKLQISFSKDSTREMMKYSASDECLEVK